MEASSALDTEIRVIEIHMMDTFKFYPLTITTGLAVRALIYPMTLIRTRLQSQSGKAVYKGTVDAFLKISHDRGLRGLYRGFGVSCFQSVSSVVYLYSYENVRRWLSQSIKDSHYCSMLAGGAASCVNQCFIVPLDVISQHLMLIESKRPGAEKQIEKKLQTLQHIQLSEDIKNSRFGAVNGICKEIYRLNGLRGFYKGYVISLGVYMPSSMCWWFFYDRYGGLMVDMLPDFISRMLIHMGAASLAAISTSVLTNPLDLLRTRVQVRGESIRTSLNILWREEGLVGICTKALPARVTSSIIFSLFIATGYESVKRFSLKEEFKGDVRW